MKLASWNVNGIRALMKKDDWQWFEENRFDVIGLQEIKAEKSQFEKDLAIPDAYDAYYCSSQVKKGYSGVAVFSKIKPINVVYELPSEEYQGEGRILHLEFDKFHYINGYFPNGGEPLADENGKFTGNHKRLNYKMGFFDCFYNYAEELTKNKPLVVCGDFNIAHHPIDLARPKTNTKSTGFLPIERAFLDKFTENGYVDTFRQVHGNIEDKYTWWSYKSGARPKNVGWRIDYFFVSQGLKSQVKDAWIEDMQMGSDHCPVALELNI